MYNNREKIRAHPIMIFNQVRRFLWLWIIPIIRAMISALKGELSLWSQGLWLDIVVIFAILAFATVRWWVCSYNYDDTYLCQQEGFFLAKRVKLEWDKVSVLKIMSPFYLRPLNAVIIHADTIGGSPKDTDINIYISKKESEKLIEFFAEMDGNVELKKEFIPKKSAVFGFALVSSNYFASFLYISTFISQSGKILGEEFSTMIIGSFENLSRVLSEYIPPAAAAIAYLLLFAWLIGVITTVMRYHKYKVIRKESSLLLSGGLLSKQIFVINTDQINYLDIRQNIITFFLNACSVFLSVVGTGKEKSDINCIVPTESRNTYMSKIEYLFPEVAKSPPVSLKPVPTGFMRFINAPIASILGVIVLLTISLFLIPSWSSFIRFVSYMLIIPCVGFLVVRLVEFRSSGIGKQDGFYTMICSTGFTLHTLIMPTDKVISVRIQQSLIQYATGNCDVYLYTASEQGKKHKCRNIKKSEAIKFFNIQDDIEISNTFGRLIKFIYNKFNIYDRIKKRRKH